MTQGSPWYPGIAAGPEAAGKELNGGSIRHKHTAIAAESGQAQSCDANSAILRMSSAVIPVPQTASQVMRCQAVCTGRAIKSGHRPCCSSQAR